MKLQHLTATQRNWTPKANRLAILKARVRHLRLESLEPRHLLAGVVISEFLASNSGGLLDEDGDRPDWIELHNTDSTPVNLDGWYLTDNASNLTKWRIPAIQLAADEYRVIFASGKDRSNPGQPLHTNFALSAGGEYLGLVMPNGTTVAHAYAPQFPPQVSNISYGLGQVVAEYPYVSQGSTATTIVPTDATYDAVWSSPAYQPGGNWTVGPTGVGYAETFPGFAVKNYKAAPGILVNSLAVAEDLIGNPANYTSVVSGNYSVVNFFGTGSTGMGRYTGDSPFPGGQINVNVDDFVTVSTAVVTVPAAGNWTFGVRSDDGFRLVVGDFTTAFTTTRTTAADTLATFEFTAAGNYPLYLLHFERNGGSQLELFAASGTFSAWNSINFRLVGDAAGGGLVARADVIGSGGAGIYQLLGTNLQSQMQGVNSTFYTRLKFQVDDPSILDHLLLRMKYDDAFVATINGVEVGRGNVMGATSWNSVASTPRTGDEPTIFEELDITSALSLLVPGENLLAIHGLNVSSTDMDALILPELVGTKVLSTGEVYFQVPTPGGPNSNGYQGFIDEPQFSVAHGFYDAPINVAITSNVPTAQIYYTTNGSVPTATNGTRYTGPITISSTKTLRAAAIQGGYLSPRVGTQTYIFLADVIQQSATPPPGWPTSTVNSQIFDYGMDPDIVNSPVWGPQLVNALRSIPVFSIVTDLPNLFHPTTGIYVNALQEGRAWERPTSIEYIHPDGTEGFQIDAGLRIRGGVSRNGTNPKHSFRVIFRSEYEGSLNYPLFGSAGASVFENLDLRTDQNISWAFQANTQTTFLRDAYSRIAAGDMEQPFTRGDFAFVYINGVFWGMYQTEERPEAFFGATYLGGNKSEYDVIKPEAGPYTISATDGNLDAWQQFWTLSNQVAAAPTQTQRYAVFMQMQGKNPDGSRNPSYPVLLDTDNLIDYMMMILWGGNRDAPISAFVNSINNWYTLRNRNGEQGFQFILHDSEFTLMNVNENRNGPYTIGSTFDRSNPQWIHQQLMYCDEYRMQFADRVQQLLFNGGQLTTANNLARHQAMASEIALAVIGESARWGDAKRAVPFTQADWQSAVNVVNNSFMPGRNAVLITQFRNTRLQNATTGPLAPLFPSLDAPLFSQFGGMIDPGFVLTLSKTAGSPSSASIYYTLDGSDPRLVGGGISPSAILYAGPITLDTSTRVKARLKDGTTWSAVVDATFLSSSLYPLRITELHYNPAAVAGVTDRQDMEFIELLNVSTTTIGLDGVQIAGFANQPYIFTEGLTLAANQRIIVARNPAVFQQVYGTGIYLSPIGYSPANLSNAGEQVILRGPFSEVLQDFVYSDSPPWPTEPDGNGPSLEIIDPLGDPANPQNWRASLTFGGSPGTSGDPPGILGDFNHDGLLNLEDIDDLVAQIAAANHPALYDLNGDGLVNLADRDVWLAQAGSINLPSGNPYRLGDANLDGFVDGSDFGIWNANKFTAIAAWSRGDFTADGFVDGSDFGIWNSNKFTSADSGRGFAWGPSSIRNARHGTAKDEYDWVRYLCDRRRDIVPSNLLDNVFAQFE